jgi:cytochrome d ubiquinol oxidase subunit I
MSLLDLSRWQFAITVVFHMTFPAITVGLSILLSVGYGMWGMVKGMSPLSH